MKYEPGMSIWYEKGAAVVYFRNVRRFLPGPFRTAMEAARAGEALCRTFGWDG